MHTFLTQTNGALPADLTQLKATEVEQHAKVAVDRQTRALLVRNIGQGDRPNTAATSGQTGTVTNTAQTLADMGVSLHSATQWVLISVENADVRIDPIGGTPTASVGQPALDGDQVMLSRTEALTAKWIRQASTNATLQISEYL
jgi:hypothetical protein